MTLPQSLKQAYASNFPFGAAIQSAHTNIGAPQEPIIRAQFSSITAEFEMKADQITQSPGVYDFTAADRLMDFAEANGIAVRGHALVWHQSTPDYMLEGSPDVIRFNLESFIDAIVSRYRGRIYAWDVVNEAATDNPADPTAPYRNSNWHAAVGKDYIDWAFNAARAADPDASLFINDYNTELSGKRERLLEIVRDLLDRGVPIDGVGHQAHLNVGSSPADLMAAIDAVDSLGAGLENHITELDVSVYVDPGECFSSQTNCAPGYGADFADVPQDVRRAQAEIYRAVLDGAVARPSVTSVTVWGVSDADSWLNNFPISRPNHPLLFDRDFQPKEAALAVVDPDYEITG
ncbi:endo-1,4-beta-xylanase [Amphiplicatus metriothermophilus]|uniref:endo-1,4-beta-xylanase n=1 Tax=Amphiplicatus metriothermophilus TaxID=1519374 RepID=UPI00181C53EA|nr:endo-1,4-beta-xylanase [Amphiplicatus metriothermophilus]MBB5518434.1 endo-1,4-beta-xylanase [Amphiplicatus metriothermophilus]